MTWKKRNYEKNKQQILNYLDQYGIFDKDFKRGSGKKKQVKSTKIKQIKRQRRRLDLHGLKEDEAASQIRHTVYQCKENGVPELLIIHGKGWGSDPNKGPVLKTLVHAMLDNELNSVIKDWIPALPKDGGEGATVVWF